MNFMLFRNFGVGFLEKLQISSMFSYFKMTHLRPFPFEVTSGVCPIDLLICSLAFIIVILLLVF